MKKVGIIGRVNVGKSTLFNRLIGEGKSIISPIAGTTRDFISGKVDTGGKTFELIDFGGMDFEDKDIIGREMNKMIAENISMLDLIVFMVDGRSIITEKDRRIAELLRKTGKRIILAVNKIDSSRQEDNVHDFYSLGIDDLIGISAENKNNLEELLDMIIERLKIKKEKDREKKELTKIAIIGKPNVGKSSLFNVMCKKERSIVTEISGTTRDSIDSEVIIENKNYLFVDTAGLKRKSKVSFILDLFSTNKSLNAINRAEIVLYVIDVVSYVTRYDINLINYAWRRGKSIIIVVNKWDLNKDKNENKYKEILINDNSIFKKFPIIFISSLEKYGIEELIEEIKRVENSSLMEFSTSLLNNKIKSITSKFVGVGGAKVFYVTQTGTQPIELLFFVNDKNFFKKRLLDFIEKNLRKDFNLLGVPIFFKLRKRRR